MSTNPVTSNGIVAALSNIAPVKGFQLFTGNGTFTVPAGVNTIYVFMCSGSGGGTGGYTW